MNYELKNINIKEKILVQTLEKIREYLLDKTHLPVQPGLMEGKMGVALFFFHYANYKNEVAYHDYAIDLIDEIQEQIFRNTPLNYTSGLTGIGSCIAYLIRQGLIDGDSDEILSDFDDNFNRHLTDRILYLSFDNITDIGTYLRFRYNGNNLTEKCCNMINRLIYILNLHMNINPKYSEKVVKWLIAFSEIYPSAQINEQLKKQLLAFDLKNFSKSYSEISLPFHGLRILSELDNHHSSWLALL